LATTEKKSMLSRLFNKETADGNEMSFIDHLEALRWHIVRSVIAWLVAVIVIFIFRDWVFDNIILAPRSKDFVSYKIMCNFGHFLHIGDALCMPPVNIPLQGNTISGPFMAAIDISMVGGLVLAFPYIFYEIWRFIKPALSSKELRYGNQSIFWVTFCMLLGAAFGYYVLAPFTFNFLATFNLGTTGAYEYKPTLDDYIGTLTNLMLGCGVAFELPVIAYILAKIGILNAAFLKKYRGYAFIAILIIAAILTPSPDWTSQLIVAAPLLLLYEISIVLVRRNQVKKDIEPEWE
jgi:sec-independent protein translocase protein TatC